MCIFQQPRSNSSADMLPSILCHYPIDGDAYEARESHALLLDLLIAGDCRLIGTDDASQLLRVLSATADIIRLFQEAFTTAQSLPAQESDEFWVNCNVSFKLKYKIDMLLHHAPQNLNPNILRGSLRCLPDESQSYFRNW
jgi:hypothetical protein